MCAEHENSGGEPPLITDFMMIALFVLFCFVDVCCG